MQKVSKELGWDSNEIVSCQPDEHATNLLIFFIYPKKKITIINFLKKQFYF